MLRDWNPKEHLNFENYPYMLQIRKLEQKIMNGSCRKNA